MDLLPPNFEYCRTAEVSAGSWAIALASATSQGHPLRRVTPVQLDATAEYADRIRKVADNPARRSTITFDTEAETVQGDSGKP